MDLILLYEGLYHLVPVTTEMLMGLPKPEVINCFSLCDLVRENLTTYLEPPINRHVLKDGSFLFGCVCR